MSAGNDRQPPATAADWEELHPMPTRHAVLELSLTFNDDQMALIRRGFIPKSMDDRCFIYFADGRLYIHRSWTGYLTFVVPFVQADGCWRANHAVVNRDPDQYGNTNDDEDRKLIAEIVHYCLLTRDDPHGDGFAAGLALATQPNYLGSPEVVSSILTPLFATTVSWWRQLHDNSAPRVSPKELQDVETQTVNIFAGENPDYTVMPWHSVEQLGQAAIACFNLNAEYCAGESLFFVIFESIAAVSMAITKLLNGYLQDENAQWGDANLQTNNLLAFVESVMLGTHTLFNPGKTLRDFQWQPIVIEDDESEDDESEDDDPVDPHLHPCLNDKGKTVHIQHPHSGTPAESWHDEDAIATFVPMGDCPDEINGILLESWTDHPEGEDWDEVEGQLEDLEEPPMHLKQGLKPASGVIIEEPDGRVWVVSPTNQFGGYKNTFPKGKEMDEVTWQANAIKEAYEEAGLQVSIIGLIGDVERSTSVTRYYRAVRVGGMPTDVGWKSQAVHLVPIHRLKEFLPNSYDQRLLKVLYPNLK